MTYDERAVQIEWEGEPGAILVAYVSPGMYWLSTPWFGARHEQLVTVETLEDFWPPEVLELADAA